MILSMKKVMVLIIFLVFPSYAYGDIYRHILEDGTVVITNTPSDRKDRPFMKEDTQSKTINAEVKKNSKEAYYELAEKKAKSHNIDHQLIKAIIQAESNWNPYAVSKKGAMGLMQLMPATVAFLGIRDPFNPEENIEGGIKYLKYLLERFSGNLTLALAAYNAGPAVVEKIKGIPPISETINYVKRVINYYSSNNKIKDGVVLDTTRDNKVDRKEDRIKKMVLSDGTILFTNSYALNSSGSE
jgi:hypothetical protein